MHCLRCTYVKLFSLHSNTVLAEVPAFLRFDIQSRYRSEFPKFTHKPDPKEIKCDYIGPPDPISNIPQYVRHIPKNETPLQKRLREKRIEVENWNHTFWRKHNLSFYKGKEEFIKKHNLTGSEDNYHDKLSEFYKKFLDDNQKLHWDYNWSWYRKNFIMLWLEFRVLIEKIWKKRRWIDKK